MTKDKAAGAVTGRDVHKTPNIEEVSKLNKDMLLAKTIRGRIASNASDIEKHLADLKTLIKPERPVTELAHLFGVYKDIRDMMAEVLVPIVSEFSGGEDFELLKTKIVPEAFERENVTSYTTQDGYRVTVSQRYYASIKPATKDKAYDWLRENGLGDLIIATVNASTLSAAGKAMLEDQNKELPEDLFNAAYQSNTSLTRTKK